MNTKTYEERNGRQISAECEFWRKHNIGNDNYLVYFSDLKDKGWKAWQLDSTIVFLEDPNGDLSYWDYTNGDGTGLLIVRTKRYPTGGHFGLKSFFNQKDLRGTFDFFKTHYKSVVEIT